MSFARYTDHVAFWRKGGPAPLPLSSRSSTRRLVFSIGMASHRERTPSLASHLQPGEFVALTEGCKRDAPARIISTGSADSAATDKKAAEKSDEVNAVTGTGDADAIYWRSDKALADIARQNATKSPPRAARPSRSRSRSRCHGQDELFNEVDYSVARQLADQLGWCAMPNGRTLYRLTSGGVIEAPTALLKGEASGEDEYST